MAVEDYVEPEVAVAVAVTAALSSSRARRVLRKGAVYGVAGMLKVGDAVGMFAHGFGRGAVQTAEVAAASAVSPGDTDTSDESEAPPPARRRSVRAGNDATAKRQDKTAANKAGGANK